MKSRHLAVLAGTELRRLRPLLRRVAVTTAVAVLVAVVLDARDFLHLGLLALGLATAMQMPLTLVRDRLSGELLVLSVLPVPASTVVAAKFVSSLVPCGVAGVFYAVSAGLAVSELVPSVSPLHAALGTFLAAWSLFTVASFVSAALLARLGMQSLASGLVPLGFLALLVGVGWLVDVLVPDPLALLEWLLAQPWLPAALSVGFLVAAALITAVALRVTAVAVREYRPDPDALTW